MKALNILELDTLIDFLQSLEGAELQSHIVSGRDIAFRFHHEKQGSRWLVFDLNPLKPSVVITDHLGLKFPKQKSPLGLFLEANFRGAKILNSERPMGYGRVLQLAFDEDRELEARLFPHGQNFIVKAGSKKISLSKVKELEELAEECEVNECRSLRQIYLDWEASRQAGPQKTSNKEKIPTRADRIKKVQKSLKKLKEDRAKKANTKWRETGKWLSSHQSLEGLPTEYSQFVDVSQSLPWNLDNCFSKAKKTEEKLELQDQRVKELEDELKELEQLSDEAFTDHERSKAKNQRQKFKLKTKNPVKTRKLELKSGATVFVGKSAKDNLLLLRKARAWDLWIHIADVPSAHAIVFINKGQKLTDAELKKAGRFLVKTSKSQISDALLDQKVEVLVAESRYVTPIKGDKHGRVTHRNTKTIVV